jgi:hypothetical protein
LSFVGESAKQLAPSHVPIATPSAMFERGRTSVRLIVTVPVAPTVNGFADLPCRSNVPEKVSVVIDFVGVVGVESVLSAHAPARKAKLKPMMNDSPRTDVVTSGDAVASQAPCVAHASACFFEICVSSPDDMAYV